MLFSGRPVVLLATWNEYVAGFTFLKKKDDLPVEPEISTGKLLNPVKEGDEDGPPVKRDCPNAAANLSKFWRLNIPPAGAAIAVTESAPSLLAVGHVELGPGALNGKYTETPTLAKPFQYPYPSPVKP